MRIGMLRVSFVMRMMMESSVLRMTMLEESFV